MRLSAPRLAPEESGYTFTSQRPAQPDYIKIQQLVNRYVFAIDNVSGNTIAPDVVQGFSSAA